MVGVFFFLSIRLQTEPDKIFVVHFVMCGYKMCCNQLKDEMKSDSGVLFVPPIEVFLALFAHLEAGSAAAHLQHLLIYMHGRMWE